VHRIQYEWNVCPSILTYVGGEGNVWLRYFNAIQHLKLWLLQPQLQQHGTDIPLQSSTTQACRATLLPSLRCLINSIGRLQENNLKTQTKWWALTKCIDIRELKAYAIMWPKYIHVSFNFVGTGWIFQYVFLHSCVSKIHSYLQNPNSTFILIYAYDYRQQHDVPIFHLFHAEKTQPKHTTQFLIHMPYSDPCSLAWIRAQIIQYTDYLSSIQISKSMMKIDNVTALPSVYWNFLTNMPMTMVTTPTQIIGTNTCLKASIDNKTHYYPTFRIFFYLQNHLHVSMLTTVLSSVSS